MLEACLELDLARHDQLPLARALAGRRVRRRPRAFDCFARLTAITCYVDRFAVCSRTRSSALLLSFGCDVWVNLHLQGRPTAALVCKDSTIDGLVLALNVVSAASSSSRGHSGHHGCSCWFVFQASLAFEAYLALRCSRCPPSCRHEVVLFDPRPSRLARFAVRPHLRGSRAAS